MKKKTFKLATLGCRTNQYETQAFRDQLLSLGYEEAKEDETASLCIVNTCTVTHSADRSSRHEIRKLVKENEGAEVVVTGCFAERRPDLISTIGGVSRVIPNRKKSKLIEEIIEAESIPEFSIKQFEGHTRAFVKVQDGCNSFCTYCIIPYVRGRSVSRKCSEVIKEVQNLISSGHLEVVITGINVGDYDGGEERVNLAELIKAVDRIEGLKRLRLSSIDPDEVDSSLMDAILNGKTTCHSMHIVLQSGSNVILKKMNRKYTKEIFLETVNRLKEKDPHFTFTTDIIVGFPGETEKDFEETCEVISEVKFAKVHMFPYSKRERTRAALFPHQLSDEVIEERKSKLLRLAEKVSFELREGFIGQEMEILTESEISETSISGHTENFLSVSIPRGNFKPNQLVKVKLLENTPQGLRGVAI